MAAARPRDRREVAGGLRAARAGRVRAAGAALVSHLLDTNSFVDHLRRGPASNVTARLLAAPPGSVYLCSVVLAELLYGAWHSGPAHQAANLALVAGLRNQFVSLPFDDRAAEEYGKVRASGGARRPHRTKRPADRGHRPGQ